jgi:hypothetical protein
MDGFLEEQNLRMFGYPRKQVLWPLIHKVPAQMGKAKKRVRQAPSGGRAMRTGAEQWATMNAGYTVDAGNLFDLRLRQGEAS